jgi:hypothetical protein
MEPEVALEVIADGPQDPETVRRLALYQLIYSICGLVLGLACVLAGTLLFFHGVGGSTSWTAKILGTESKLSDAAPGAVLFIVGMFIVLITKFNVTIAGRRRRR